MRPFIFRGKSIDYGTWKHGGIVFGNHQWWIIEQCGGALYSVDRKTVGQYTGLSDSRNVPIFEHDLLLLRDEERDYYLTVVFSKKEAAFRLRWPKGFLSCDVLGMFLKKWPDLEVVGNIHDNPELIKKK